MSTAISSFGTFQPRERANLTIDDGNERFIVSRQLSGIYGIGLILILSPIVTAVFRELNVDFAFNFATIMSIIALVFMFFTFSMEVYFWRIRGEMIFQEVMNSTVSIYLKVGTFLFGCVAVVFQIISIINELEIPDGERIITRFYMNLSELCVYLTEIIYLYRYSQVCFQKFTIFNRYGTMHLIGTNMMYCITNILSEALIDYCTKCGTVCPLYEMIGISRTNSIVNKIYRMGSPYLAACSVEYCLIASCLLRIMWCNIGHINQDQQTGVTPQHSYQIKQSKYGIIAGIVTVLTTVTFGIVYHRLRIESAQTLFICIRIGFNASIGVCLFICLRCIDVDAGAHVSETISSTQDCVLLVCSMAFLVLQSLYTLAAATVKGYTFLPLVFDSVLCLAMTIMQSLFILSKKRCARIRSKPAVMRNLLIFLTIANLSYWVFSHYELKNEQELHDVQIDVYGELLWYSIHHVTGPIIVLFFFHSSVCLFEIWTTLPPVPDQYIPPNTIQ